MKWLVALLVLVSMAVPLTAQVEDFQQAVEKAEAAAARDEADDEDLPESEEEPSVLGQILLELLSLPFRITAMVWLEDTARVHFGAYPFAPVDPALPAAAGEPPAGYHLRMPYELPDRISVTISIDDDEESDGWDIEPIGVPAWLRGGRAVAGDVRSALVTAGSSTTGPAVQGRVRFPGARFSVDHITLRDGTGMQSITAADVSLALVQSDWLAADVGVQPLVLTGAVERAGVGGSLRLETLAIPHARLSAAWATAQINGVLYILHDYQAGLFIRRFELWGTFRIIEVPGFAFAGPGIGVAYWF